MYETHFGFRERPFLTTPDTGSYYPASCHELVLSRLSEGLADDEGLVLLTGGPGTGKTLLGHCLLERVGEEACAVHLSHSHIPNRVSFLQTLLFDLSLPYEGRSEQELRLALTDALLKTFSAGKRTLVVMDEAQNLPCEVLEELRLLANLEGRHSRAFQAVLVAQPQFLDRLRRPDLAVLAQRVAVRTTLEPLSVPEAADYLLHHIRAAGGRPDAIMSDEAVELLARASMGVPRLLNQAAHRALRLAHAAEATAVDAEVALEAIAQLGLSTETAASDPAGQVLPLGDAGEAMEPLAGPEDDAGCLPYAAPKRTA